VRRYSHGDGGRSDRVSIHAPTRGATISFPLSKSIGVFQSTHPHGVRLSVREDMRPFHIKFQSTHPHGVRQQEASLSPKEE